MSFPDVCNGIASELAERSAASIARLCTSMAMAVGNFIRCFGVAVRCIHLLWLGGRDLRTLPLLERKRRLRALIHTDACVDHIERAGTDFYRVACEHDL